MDTNTNTETNFNSPSTLPPLPAMPSEPAVQPVVIPTPQVEAVVTPVPQVDPAPQPVVIEPVQPQPPVVHLIPGPTEASPTKVSEVPLTQASNVLANSNPAPKKKSDKYNVLIAMLGFVLFIMLALVGYLVIQVFI